MGVLQIANLSVDQIKRFVIRQITNQICLVPRHIYHALIYGEWVHRNRTVYQVAFGSKEKRHILSCISATVFTKSSVGKKTTACCNSDQNVEESSPAQWKVSIPKSREKTFHSFQLYFRVAFQGFVLEVRLLYSYLRSLRYQLFSFSFSNFLPFKDFPFVRSPLRLSVPPEVNSFHS